MATYFAVYNQGATSGNVANAKADRFTSTTKVLEGPVEATVVKVEAGSLAEAKAFVRQFLNGSCSDVVIVESTAWKTS